jgi:hypothetical protein
MSSKMICIGFTTILLIVVITYIIHLPCHGLDKLWKWNVVYIGMFVRNDGALMAVKKLYIHL